MSVEKPRTFKANCLTSASTDTTDAITVGNQIFQSELTWNWDLKLTAMV